MTIAAPRDAINKSVNFMRVIKRSGRFEEVNFEKISERIKKLCWNLSAVDPTLIVTHVASSLADGISTEAIDHLTAEIAISLDSEHPDYGKLASRIAISNIHKKTSESVLETFENMASVVAPSFLETVRRHAEELQDMVQYNRDYEFDYFGIKTLERMYCTKVNGVLIERPQHMYLRVAVALCGEDGNMDRVKETYDLLSRKFFTHASPTLFNAGMKVQQLASCYLDSSEDSLDGIFSCFHRCARISKFGGGLGVNVSNVRSKGAPITSTNGHSDGIIPMLKVANSVASYVNQCFVPDTMVYTRDNGIQQMDDVEVGEHLVTRDGTFKRVNEVFVRDVKEEGMVTLTPKFAFEGITCTKVHEIFALRGQRQELNYSVIKNRLDKGISSPEFCPAGDLVVGDFLGFPIPRDVVDYSFTNDFCRFYGIMLGDGHVTIKHGKYQEFGVSLNLTSKADTVEFVKSMLEIRDIHYWTALRNNCYTIKWTGSVDGLNYDMLYDALGEKRIDPRFLNLPNDKTLSLIKGLLESDGSVRGEIYFSTSSRALVFAMRYLCLRLGVLTHGHAKFSSVGKTHEIRPGELITVKKVPYVLRIPKHPILAEMLGIEAYSKMAFFEHDGILYTRLVSVEESVYSGKVYDFNMESNHNYTTDCGLVHNSGKRKGSMAVYLEPHHPDVMDFLNLRRPGGDEDLRCRDLFLAMWVSDVFMKRVEAGGKWSFFDPSKCPGLDDVYGEDFERLYEQYEASGKAERVVDARDVWNAILRSQIESGVPYILSKDACNLKSNQKNVGTIKNSNLCAEIVEYSSPGKEVAVCTLASLGLPAFVKNDAFDFQELHRVVKVVARNLDRVIDLNQYPIEEARFSNFRHRPIGIGIQGLADTFIKLRIPFDSKRALLLNEQIMATMYHAAIEMSTELASVYGPYASYEGSPASKGLLQYDLWGKQPCTSTGLDWDALKHKVARYGLRNSLSIALMPTASTAQLLGNSEAAEPVTSFFYVRRTLAGEYACIHKLLLKDLVGRGLWTKDIKNAIIRDGGSIQNIPDIPDDLKTLYKTSWDLKQRVIIDQAAARGPYVCQSQSMNLFIAAPTFAKLTAMHLYSWKKGLKTINYYLRSKPASRAAQVTVDSSSSSLSSLATTSSDEEEACVHCSA